MLVSSLFVALALSNKNLKNKILKKEKGNKTLRPDLLSEAYSILGTLP